MNSGYAGLPPTAGGAIRDSLRLKAQGKDREMAVNKYYAVPTLEEYSERFKDFFKFKREGGILAGIGQSQDLSAQILAGAPVTGLYPPNEATLADYAAWREEEPD